MTSSHPSSDNPSGRTVSQCQTEGARRLAAAGIAPIEARLEARMLLSHASGLSREEIHLRPDALLSPSAAQMFGSLLMRREKREPLAYILEEREFYGLSFYATPAVLIPRPETEFLVEAVTQKWKQHPSPRLADIGTGSGIIAVSLAVNIPQATVYATDLSAEALIVARENARRHDMAERVFFVEGDLLEPLRDQPPFEAIASNPPYITPADIETLETEVRDFEPRMALGTHPDPLHFYRRLAAESPPLLVSGGILAVEVGQGQADDVAALWRASGLINISTVRDYAGIERVVAGHRP